MAANASLKSSASGPLTFSGEVDPATSRPKSNLNGMIATTNLNITPNPAQSDAFSAFELAAWNALNAPAVTETATTTATPTTAEATTTIISALPATSTKPETTDVAVTSTTQPAVPLNKSDSTRMLPLGIGGGTASAALLGLWCRRRRKNAPTQPI